MTNPDDGGPLLFSMPGSRLIGARLAEALAIQSGSVALRDFPDGESYVKLEQDPRDREVVIVESFKDPNDKILAIVFLADAARDLGATRVGLVAPYLAYMRQDARFHSGEAITSRSFASIVSAHVDWLVAVDPHLHRFASLEDVYTVPATCAHAGPALGRWIAQNVTSPFIIGPDAESRQWVDAIATAAHAPSTVVTKVRRGDTDVVETIPDLEGHGSCTPVLVDDIISTGQTLVAAVRHLREQGAVAPVCVAVHAVFANNAEASLRDAGAARIVTTNTIVHPTNAIDVTPVLATAVLARLAQPAIRSAGERPC